jgi:UDP-N-acetylglucosamine 2-epimerase
MVAAKMGVKIAHVETGLRSFDRTMPEEINRMVTDTLSDYLFVTEQSGLDNRISAMQNLVLLDPIGYLDFMKLMHGAKLVLTDSGGIQEETTYLYIPCITLRENTKRPVTIDVGTNVLVGSDTELVISEAKKVISGQ